MYYDVTVFIHRPPFSAGSRQRSLFFFRALWVVGCKRRIEGGMWLCLATSVPRRRTSNFCYLFTIESLACIRHRIFRRKTEVASSVRHVRTKCTLRGSRTVSSVRAVDFSSNSGFERNVLLAIRYNLGPGDVTS